MNPIYRLRVFLTGPGYEPVDIVMKLEDESQLKTELAKLATEGIIASDPEHEGGKNYYPPHRIQRINYHRL